MTDKMRMMMGSFLLGLVIVSTSGCIVATHEPHEGYYDRDHHRWYHEHEWRECGDHDRDDHCR